MTCRATSFEIETAIQPFQGPFSHVGSGAAEEMVSNITAQAQLGGDAMKRNIQTRYDEQSQDRGKG